MATWENKYTELSNVNSGNKIEDSDVIIAEHANVALQNTAHLKTLLNNSVIRDVAIDSANKRMVLTIATKGNNDSSATISTVYINANNVGAVSLDVADSISGTTRSYIYNFGSSFLISSIDINNSNKKNTLSISKDSATLTTGDGTNTKIIDLTTKMYSVNIDGKIRNQSNEIVGTAKIVTNLKLRFTNTIDLIINQIPQINEVMAFGYFNVNGQTKKVSSISRSGDVIVFSDEELEEYFGYYLAPEDVTSFTVD